nr:PREDICTED: uncharacterized protein C10orf67 homolog isoform X2 [Latimeria chalumnae]|eukprot:XP_014346438.1 PREDICTED: uncharacterized protein C10orf67 homolog isoform X2 [Latimeria chalumnae]
METDFPVDRSIVCSNEDDIFALQLFSTKDDFELRPSVSEELKVGFFGSDHATQTNVTELFELKELTTVIQNLEKNLDKVRRRFDQQFKDAYAVLSLNYQKTTDEDHKIEAQAALLTKNRTLTSRLHEQESLIDILKEKLKEYEDHTKEIDVVSEPDLTVEKLENENGELKEEIFALQEKIEHLIDSLNRKERQIKELETNIYNMKCKIEENEHTISQLVAIEEKLKTELEQEKAAASHMLQEEKTYLEKELQKKLIVNQSEMQTHEAEAQKLIGLEREKQALLLENMKSKKPSQESQKPSAREAKLVAELEKYKKSEQKQKKRIENLTKDLDQVSKIWEKKFAVLKQSLYAIKDEMFLRQSLQRQAAALHHASISYAADGPIGVMPGVSQLPVAHKIGYYYPRIPLPQIDSRSTVQMERGLHTTTVPSGPGTDAFTAGESQIVSEDEDFDGIFPLPSPPSTGRQESDNSSQHLINVMH